MDFLNNISSVFETIRSNRLRSFLTLLSVAIGVFSIISVMTALGALQNSFEQGLSQLGANTFQVQKYESSHGGGPDWMRQTRNRKDITYRQGLAVLERTKGTKNIGLEVWNFGVEVQWRKKKTDPNISVAGETPGGLPTNQWEVQEGRGISQSDVDFSRNVVVLGKKLSAQLFPPSINPVGQKVKMGGRSYSVIGTLKEEGGLFGNRDNYFIIPITTFFETFGNKRSLHIMVQAQSRENFEAVQDEVIGILRAARDVPAGQENDFAIFSNDSMIKEFDTNTYYVRVATIAIAGIALLAAGIGIMNIMLVSVTERTREIGIRKAVGAPRKSIVVQFLFESVAITLLGGIVGIIAGLAAGNGLAVAIGIPIVVDISWVLFGIAACTAIGVLFGTYPAWKASNLDPIEALRFE